MKPNKWFAAAAALMGAAIACLEMGVRDVQTEVSRKSWETVTDGPSKVSD